MFLCSDDGSSPQYLHYMTNEPVNVANIWPHQNNAMYKQIFLVSCSDHTWAEKLSLDHKLACPSL